MAMGQVHMLSGRLAALRVPFVLVLAAGSAIVNASALAQSSPATPPAEASAQTGQLEEIVVTAEKRSSTIQTTPISITAITGSQLTAQGISGLSTLAVATPGVAIRSAGPGQTEIDMRGLTSSGGASPTVGFYLDETPVTPPAGANNGKVVIDPNLYDLDRVEILRGPQGTLYGSGSMGGTVKLLTAQPKFDEFSGSIEATGSGTEGGGLNGSVNASINLPIVNDKLALRVVGTELHNSGWIDRVVVNNFPLEPDFNPAAGPPSVGGYTRGDVQAGSVSKRYSNVNDEDLQGIRANLVFAPTDELTITPSVFYQRITQGGYNTFDSPPGKAPATLAHYQPFDIAEPFADQFRLFSLLIKYDLDDVELTSATGQWSRQEGQTQDLSEDFQELLILPFYLPAALTETDTSQQFSQEFRVASRGQSDFNWLVGAFYSKFRSTFIQQSTSDDYIPIVGISNLIDERQPQTIRQYAFFANASYQITPILKATVGLRYYDFKSTMSVYDTGVFASGSNDAITVADKESASGVTPMASLALTPNEDLTVYGTISKGFRPGGGNQLVPVSVCGPDTGAQFTYDPDTVWNYELGEKARLLDRRVTVNSAIYYEDWQNIQTQVPLPCGFFFTNNSESAGVYGAELEITARATNALTISLSGGYTHATYAKNSSAGYVVGDRIPDIPEFTGDISLTYQAPAFGDYDYLARIEDNLVGPFVDYTFSQNRLPGYNLVNLRFGLVSDAVSGFFFINNLSNVRTALSDTNSLGANLPTFNRVATGQPRTIGVTLKYNF
jgi:outer membrane receptor protein involved in Fe transport